MDDLCPEWAGMGWHEILSHYTEQHKVYALYIVYYWNFAFNISGSCLATGNELQKAKSQIRRGEYCTTDKNRQR